MKVTRSYWLGLGSGLILSAMLVLVISPKQGQAVTPPATFPVSPIQQQETTQPPQQQPAEDIPTPTPTLATAPTEQTFIIPKGASSEKIADLLVAQGFIKDKASFLINVHKVGAETKFRAGTFTLSAGLTTEELLGRLVK
ncbi:MAG TPA: ABC transporter substrate-binding protein [Desulfosporosinus sp.]|nr:ABC transporter substrate-binding protein [Desulfosporosinus sp.]